MQLPCILADRGIDYQQLNRLTQKVMKGVKILKRKSSGNTLDKVVDKLGG